MKFKILPLFLVLAIFSLQLWGKKSSINNSPQHNTSCNLSVYVTTTPYNCKLSEGTAMANAYYGTAPYTYDWSNGLTTSSIDSLIPGTYAVTVTDNSGCKATSFFTIDSVSISISGYISPTTIEAGNPVYLNAYISDSIYTSSDSVSWSPSSSVTSPHSFSTTAYPKTTTTYTLTVITPCLKYTDTMTVFVGCSLRAYTGTNPYYCVADMGSAYVQAYNGTLPFTYNWNNGETTAIDTDLSPGTYSVTVTDSDGCTALGTATISSSPFISAWAYPSTIESGEGTNLEVLASDSSAATDSVSWSPSASVTNPHSYLTTAYPKTTTTYTVTIKTLCGILTDTVKVSMGCSMTAYLSAGQEYYCPKQPGSATIAVYEGVPPYTYLWSDGVTTSTDSNLTDTTYTVTVTDSNGCSSTGYVFIPAPSLTLSAYANPVSIVPGGSTTLSAYFSDSSQLNMDTVSWSPALSVTSPNAWYTKASPAVTTTYTVTVTSPCGTFTDTVTVFVNSTCSNNYDQFICIVTTDTAIDKNVIVWGRNNSPPDGSFNVYDSTSSGWKLIGNVPDTALSEYIDTASNPTAQSYSYRISTVDSCGESALSPLNSTIFLQVIQYTGNDSLYWTPCIGIATPVYRIYRGPSLNALTLIDSVSASTYSYIDNSPPPGSIYLVEAINPSSGCIPTHRHISPHNSTDISTSVSLSNGGVPKKPTGMAGIVSPDNYLVISPNPANGMFTINYNLLKDETVNITVINEFGQTVYEKQLINQQAGISKQLIDIENAPEGIYSLRLVCDEGIIVRKVVVLKSR